MNKIIKILSIGFLIIGLAISSLSVVAIDLDPGPPGGGSGTSGTATIQKAVEFTIEFYDSTFGTNTITVTMALQIEFDYYYYGTYRSFIYTECQSLAEVDESIGSGSAIFVSRDPYTNYVLNVGSELVYSYYTTSTCVEDTSSLFNQVTGAHDVYFLIQISVTVNSIGDTHIMTGYFTLVNEGIDNSDWDVDAEITDWGSINDVDMDFFSPSWF